MEVGIRSDNKNNTNNDRKQNNKQERKNNRTKEMHLDEEA